MAVDVTPLGMLAGQAITATLTARPESDRDRGRRRRGDVVATSSGTKPSHGASRSG